MKRHLKSMVLASAGAVVLAVSLLHLRAGQTALKLVPTTSPSQPGQFTLKLQVQIASNSVIYVVQTSTNLVDWQTLVSGKGQPGALIQVADIPAANQAQFFRARELPADLVATNPPSWTNGVGAQFKLTPPSGVRVGWAPPTNDVGVAQYSLFLNGVLITNLLGSTLSYQFTLDFRQSADIRIQAVDPLGNLSPILSLVYLPGNGIAAISDDSGHVYAFNYIQTNSIQTNAGFTAARQIANFGSNDRGLGLGDFDRDGILDLVAGYANGNTLVPFFFKGIGDGTFAPGVALPQVPGTQNSYVMDMTVGDFDGDGNLDFVVNGNNPYVVFYWGNGDGTFTTEVKNWGDGGYYYGRGTVAGDFNEDGREDLARATCCNGMLKVFLSNGDRTFIETNLVASGLGNNDPYALAAGDFDEDGHLDLIVAGGGNGDVTFFKGFGNGTFTNLGVNGLWANLKINTYGGWDAYDYDGDGHLDLVMAANNGQAYFWPGNGDGTFSSNRVTLATGLSAAWGASAPPRPARVDVGISPRDPVTNLNGTLTFSAVGSGVSSNDFFRWTFGDSGTNLVAWTFGAGTNNMGPTVGRTYTNEGRFLTRLWHTTTNGINSVRGAWAIVKGTPPVANPGGPYVFGSQVATQGVWYATLDGSASTDDYGIIAYTWNFGDGTVATSSEPRAFHGWPSNGVYAVSLTVMDAARQSSTKGTTITFTNGAPPVAVITGLAIVDETNAHNGTWTATFSSASSSGPVGIWQYAWRNLTTSQTGSGSSFQTTWSAVGTNVITLTLTAQDSQTNSATFVVWVKANGLPVPVIQGPHLLTVDVATNGLWFGAWNATNSTDDTGIYLYNWNFGDGNTASGPLVTHNYGAQGIYPLTLTVTDNGNQSVTATQNVIVVAGNPPVAKITASTLSPEAAQPISFSGGSSASDHGIYLYTWFLPPRQFDFVGQYLDPNQWSSTYTVQNNKLTITGQNNWGVSYCFSIGTLLQRGCSIQGRVDTPSTSASHAMVGLKNLNIASGQFGQYPYAIYFDDGGVRIYEYASDRGAVTNYLKGTAYDFRIETKPGAGARYYLRPSGTGQAFTLIYDSNYATDASFSFGADVYASVWSFEQFQVDHVFATGSNLKTPVNPGGTVTLQVVDNALLTNSTSVVVTPVIGAPPVAGINGPTNGQAGVQLAFDGYSSSDDYGIASYTWNFGDGSAAAFGPAVTHSYGTTGTYTNTLTAMDYANQSSSATLVVTITGSNALVHVPWLFVNGIEQPHSTYSGKTNTLKAVARGIPVPFTNVWDFGDASGTVTNVITNSALLYNLEAKHAYTGANGTPYYAGVTVILSNGTVLADTYPLLIRTKTIDIEEQVAIDEGMWYMQKTQNRYDFADGIKGGDWTSVGYKINATASCVSAFAVNGHLMTDDANRDPYVDTVQRGVNYLLNSLSTVSIGTQPYGDPDGNGNGIGLQGASAYPIYETGPLLDALVAAGRAELIAPAGGANVKGRALKDIMQDLVDIFAWGQYDDPTAGGGWRYGWNSFPDNSACQWAAIGMLAAERFWGITAPQWVKDRNLVWLNYSQGGSGFGYTGPGDGIATTPSAMVQLAYDGVTTTNALWQHGENFLANNWTSGQNIVAQNNVYANYAIAKSLRTANPQPVRNFALTGKDWFLDPNNGLARVTIDRQFADGSWNASAYVDAGLATPWSVLILSSSLFQQGPVAVINVSPNPSAVGYPVIFDGRGSYHKHPGYKIVDYRWIFDSSKGFDFDHPDATGPVTTNVYGSFSTNTVFLQVRDNGTPQLLDVASVVVQTTIPPYPPAADAGGPYVACAGQDVHLDASGSFCVDASAGNFIQSYDWEVHYQVPVTFNQGVSGVHAVVTNGYPVAGNYTIGLRVKNADSLVYTNFALPDETADAFTTVYVYDRVIPDLKARPKATEAQLTWTKTGDYGVIMRSSLGPDRGFVQVGQATSSYATFLDSTVEYNTDYYYRVYAYQNGKATPLGVSDPVFLHSLPRAFDQHAPQFQSTPLRLAKVGQLYEVTLDAVDPENKPMFFSLLAGPSNMTVEATSGVVDFTPTTSQVGNNFVSFQVTNNVGRDVLSYTIFVFPATNHPPVAVINGPFAALTGQDIQFSSAGTMDADNNPLRYAWNFGDGSTSTNANPVHAYGGVGDYLVSFFVNDGYGATATAQTHAQISRPNVPPVAVVSNGPNFAVRLGETLALDGSASYSPLGNPLTYSWLWGDGAMSNNAPGIVSHIYAAGGPYFGGLTVADNRGGSNTYDFQVTVGPSNSPPVIVLTVSTDSPFVESIVTFDATASFDPDGDPMTFAWDFGDRSKTTGPLVTHVFHQIGEFTVTLTVADDHGGVSTATQLIHALNAPPVFTSNPPLLTRAGTNYTYTPTITDADGDRSTFQLVTGPVTMSCDTNTGTLIWLPGTNNLGPNPIVLRATDANGASTDQPFTLVVSTPLGPQLDLQPTHIEMTNVVVDSETLALSGIVRVYLSNNGSDPVPVPFTVSVFVDADFDGAFSTNADYVVGYGVFPAGFPANGSAYVDMTVNGQALFKDCPLYAFVDSQNTVPEYNEFNNIMRSGSDANTNTPPVIDLSASSLQVGRRSLPTNALLTARLGNSGLVSVPTNVPMAFYDGDPRAGGTLLGVARSTMPLSPGMYQDLSVTWAAPTIAAHTVFVVADDPGTHTNVFPEITLSNNTFSVVVDLSAVLPPIADAGLGQNVIVGDTVALNGLGSSDPQGRALTYRWSMLSTPLGSQAHLSGTNTASPSFLADLSGLYSAQLVVNNGLMDSTNAAVVSVAANDTNVFYPPTITSTPSFQAMVSVPYTYQVTATDPQSKPLKFRLPQPLAGMTINTNTGLVQWTPTNSSRSFVQVVADGVGGSCYQNYTLTVIAYTNLPPQFTSTPVLAVAPTSAYTYTAVAVSPVGNAITYSLAAHPTGMSINGSSGAISWSPTSSQLGGNAVAIAANDGHGGIATQSYNLVVLASGTNGPVVQPIPDQTTVAPATFFSISLDNYVSDPSYARNQLLWSATGTNFLTVSIDSNRVATILYPQGVNAAEQITFLATDPAGKSSYSAPLFTVVGNATPPVAAIANLSATDTTSIQTGFFNLLGTADDPGVPVPVAYRIGLYDSAGARVADLTPGPTDPGGWHEGRVPAGGNLGNLDFTLVRNGAYTLMLEVQANGANANATAQIALDSQLKIGQLKFANQDIVLPVAGLGLQVIRSYDSLNPISADFGYSWTYTVADLGLTIDEQRAQSQDAVDGTPFSLRTGGGWDVTLDMPDTGNRVTFVCSIGSSTLFKSQAYWTPPPGVYASLAPVGSPNLVTLPGLPPYWEAAGIDTDWQSYDFPGFVLTTADGNQYLMSRKDEGEHFYLGSDTAYGNYVHAYSTVYLTRIVQQTGDRTEFVRQGATLTGVEVYDRATNKLSAVLFQRDSQNRVQAIYTPRNLDSNGVPAGPADMVYEYDNAGNLTKANKLTDSSNPTNLIYATTTYSYGNPRFPHYITEARDPRGVPASRMEFDLQGRLAAIIDADGRRIELQHNLDAHTDTVFDRLGNPTVFGYDDRGNVVVQVDALGGITSRAYDDNNNMILEVDPLGHTNQYTYDSSGKILSSTDPLGNVSSRTYDSNGYVLASINPLGDATRFEYDGAGNLLATIDAAGNATRRSFDAGNHMINMTDAAGNVTSFEHDAAGNVVRQTDPLGHDTTSTFDANGNLLTQSTVVTLLDGSKRTDTTFAVYDAAGRQISATDAAGNVTLTEYDLLGHTSATVDPLGHRTEFTYDNRGNLIKTLFPDGTSTTTVYDAADRRVAETDREGSTTYYQYDALGRLVTTIYPDDTHSAFADKVRTSIEYDAAGRVAATIEERGNRTAFAYDAAGHQIAVTNALGAVTTQEYDAAGRVVAGTDTLGQTTFYTYDNTQHPILTVFPDGTMRRSAYDALGRVMTSVDEAGAMTRFQYDGLSHLTNVVDALGHSTSSGYNEEGQLARRRDALGRETRYEFENCCQRGVVVLPRGQRMTTIYNGGNVTVVTNFDGQALQFEYDANNRLTTKRFPDGSSVQFTYSPGGKVRTVRDTRGVTQFDYDSRERLVLRTDPNGQAIAYTYDEAGNRTSVTTTSPSQPGQSTTTYGYDALDRLQTVVDPDGSVTHYTYDAADRLVRVELPNGMTTTNAFDARNRLTFVEHRARTNLLSNYRYILGPAGNRLQVQEGNGRKVGYEYDAVYRLLHELIQNDPTSRNLTNSYAYDDVGNRLSWVLESDLTRPEAHNYAYDLNDELLAETNSTDGVMSAFTYDSNGNPLSCSNALETATYTWNAENLLVAASVTDSNGVTRQLSYEYDENGIRVAATLVQGGQTNQTIYLVDSERPFAEVLEEWNSQGGQPFTQAAAYTYGNQLLTQKRAGVRSYYHQDALGSTRALTDQSGQATDWYDFDAYGRELRPIGATSNPYLFAGEQRDASVGLYYLRDRYLQVRTGRFYGRDPVEGAPKRPLSMNPYIYAENDPVNRIDPSGQQSSLIENEWVSAIRTILEKSTAVYGFTKGYCKAKGVVEIANNLYMFAYLPLVIYQAQAALQQADRDWKANRNQKKGPLPSRENWTIAMKSPSPISWWKKTEIGVGVDHRVGGAYFRLALDYVFPPELRGMWNPYTGQGIGALSAGCKFFPIQACGAPVLEVAIKVGGSKAYSYRARPGKQLGPAQFSVGADVRVFPNMLYQYQFYP